MGGSAGFENGLDDLVAGDGLAVGGGAGFELDGGGGQGAAADGAAEGEADEVGVVEFDAGAVAAIVQQDGEAGFLQFCGQALGVGGDVTSAQLDDVDVVGRDADGAR